MAEHPTVEETEEADDYYHVRYRDPDEFDEIRTPDWAEQPAGAVSEGSEVRTGEKEGENDWSVQSVLIPEDDADDDDEAAQLAQQIVEKIE